MVRDLAQVLFQGAFVTLIVAKGRQTCEVRGPWAHATSTGHLGGSPLQPYRAPSRSCCQPGLWVGRTGMWQWGPVSRGQPRRAGPTISRARWGQARTSDPGKEPGCPRAAGCAVTVKTAF